MFKKSKLKIGTKIVLQAMIILIIILVSVFAYIIVTTRNSDVENANTNVKNIAEKNASIISSELESTMNSARTIAQSMQGFEGIPAEQRRDFYNNMMKSVLAGNSNILGIWTIWEPNAVDGNDAAYVNKEGSDATGRFVPYWVWVDGEIQLTAVTGYETEGAGDFYLKAKNSGQETIMEPYEYEISGKKVLLTTVSIPIKDSTGKVVGVTGIDLTLDGLQSIAFDKGQYSSAYVFTVSNSGNLIIYPDASQVGKNLQDANGQSDVSGAIKAIQSGEAYTTTGLSPVTNEMAQMLYTPVQIGNTTTPWSTGLVVNTSDVMAASNQTTLILILIFIAALAVIGIALWLMIKSSVSRPITESANLAKALSEGRLDEKILITSSDEIGQLSGILDNQVRGAFREIREAQTLSEKRNAYQGEQVEQLMRNLEKLSRGDLNCDVAVKKPDADTQELYALFTGINESFSDCINAVRELIKDADMLAQSAVMGKLETRADAKKHGGDFGKIVAGVNSTLDAVVGPIREATAVLNELAKGNLNVSMDGDYKGDHAIIKGAMNETIRSIKGYIFEISEVLGEMASGNLCVSITSEFKGNFVELKDSINSIIDSLNGLLSEINTAAEQVNLGAQQVSNGNQAISQGATEQASSIEELSATVAGIAVQTKENAENSRLSNEMAAAAKNAAALGNNQMKGMLKSMEDINASSESISKIIKVIDDIAFQTNMLALNAAVEAARAGVHGKGFAVVAEEVRNLAARSAKAAKETAVLIEGSKKKVDAGTRIANDTAEALTQIVDSVERTVELGEKIAMASNEQAAGIGQVNQGIGQMSQVVQTNSATSEEGAAASEELSGQAELLKEKIGMFRLKNAKQVSGGKKLLGGDSFVHHQDISFESNDDKY